MAYNYNTKDLCSLSHVNMDRNEHEKLDENKLNWIGAIPAIGRVNGSLFKQYVPSSLKYERLNEW